MWLSATVERPGEQSSYRFVRSIETYAGGTPPVSQTRSRRGGTRTRRRPPRPPRPRTRPRPQTAGPLHRRWTEIVPGHRRSATDGHQHLRQAAGVAHPGDLVAPGPPARTRRPAAPTRRTFCVVWASCRIDLFWIKARRGPDALGLLAAFGRHRSRRRPIRVRCRWWCHPAHRRPRRSRADVPLGRQIVRPVGRSALPPRGRPTPRVCGSTADGMARRRRARAGHGGTHTTTCQ